jgi:CYTH domain-containing protein
MKEIEIERKWVLKKNPVSLEYEPHEVFSIVQFYLKSESDTITERVRSIRQLVNGEVLEKYIYTKKEFIPGQVGQPEEEKEISESEFDKLRKNATGIIQKDRYRRKIGEITWFVDVFNNINLVLLEGEIVARETEAKEKEEWLMKQPIDEMFSDLVIMEVTGMREFSNSRLSMPV